MLPTTALRVWGPMGHSLVVRAILDSGSQGCILSSWLVSQLSIQLWDHEELVRGIGNVEVTNVVGRTHFTFSPTSSSHHKITTSAIVFDNILGRHPQIPLSPCVVNLTSGMTLADPQFHIPGPVDVLLGADVLGSLLSGKPRIVQPGGLSILPTIFGNVVFGPTFRVPLVPSEEQFLDVGISLTDAVQRFWQIEEAPTARRVDPDHDECELFFKNNTRRLRSGRFVTRLPFLASRPTLGASRALAERRLVSMERRMSRDRVFREKYIDFMKEYEELGHMTVSQLDLRSVEHYFLPHHAVLKASSGKIRVVFDGSAPTSNGTSLNQCLHAGPKLHRDICDILTNFRRHQIVFVTDIRMMFRQTIIHPDDRRYQLILWRESPESPIVVYELNTNTYGLKSSPFVAIRSLWELAEQERLNFPRASIILKEDLYVDDICTGADTVSEALMLRDELIEIMRSGGYELRKWLSNSPELLVGLPEDHQQDPHLFENVDNPNMIAVLGVQYRPVQDIFTYGVELTLPHVWTKRQVLSTVARTFDPNGWISPVVFLAKCFLQKLWTA